MTTFTVIQPIPYVDEKQMDDGIKLTIDKMRAYDDGTRVVTQEIESGPVAIPSSTRITVLPFKS